MAGSVMAPSRRWARSALLVLLVAGVAGCGVAGCGASAADLSASASAGGGSAGGSGQGGGGGEAPSAPPVQASAIAVGAAHTCALLAGGSVACWGDGSYGQLGDGVPGDHHVATPALVPGLSGATAIRAGGNTTCAVVQGGAVTCWGDGTYGQLGDGKSGIGNASSSPVQVDGISGAVDLAASGTNACAALAGGTAWCWGLNSTQQWLGFASSDCGPYQVQETNGKETWMEEPCEPAPRQVPGVAGGLGIADGGEHVCALFDGGVVRCWGADNFGQLGDGLFGPNAHTAVPTLVVGLDGVTRLALGASHTCALLGAGQGVVCWGDNSYGQLGIGAVGLDSYQTAPTKVPDLAGALDLDAAAETTCAVLVNGTVQCWGDVSQVLSTPASPDVSSPQSVAGVASAVEVRTGGGHACVLREDQTVVCWGRNDLGQLGNGTIGPSDFTMVAVAAPQAGPG
jgi:alpha-tubulin suppressor-like RCC1 family protein